MTTCGCVAGGTDTHKTAALCTGVEKAKRVGAVGDGVVWLCGKSLGYVDSPRQVGALTLVKEMMVGLLAGWGL